MCAYMKYAEQMEDLDVDISTVYWILFQKPHPDDEGGCAYDDLSWRKRNREFDYITWEGAQKRAREAVVRYDETAPAERNDDVAVMLGAAGRFREEYTSHEHDTFGDDAEQSICS
jgi:hypothetical protein